MSGQTRTLYLRPDKNWSFGATVSGSASDTDHDLQWLVDGRPGFPLRLQTGTATLELAKAAGLVTLVAIGHHLLDAELTVTVGGDVAGEIEIPAYGLNGVPFNAWGLVADDESEPIVETLTIDIAGNSTDILIGELMAGDYDVLDPSFRLDDLQFEIERFFNTPSGNVLSGIPPYSERAEARPLSGSLYATVAQLAEILDWWRSEDAFAYPVPSFLVTNDEDPTSGRFVRFANKPTWKEIEVAGPDPYYIVQLDFLEYPRTRW
jgi:hypothetical protein